MTLARNHTDVTGLPGAVVIGTDGSCVTNPGPTGWAYVADDGTSACADPVSMTMTLASVRPPTPSVHHGAAQIRTPESTIFAIVK